MLDNDPCSGVLSSSVVLHCVLLCGFVFLYPRSVEASRTSRCFAFSEARFETDRVRNSIPWDSDRASVELRWFSRNGTTKSIMHFVVFNYSSIIPLQCLRKRKPSCLRQLPRNAALAPSPYRLLPSRRFFRTFPFPPPDRVPRCPQCSPSTAVLRVMNS